MDNIDNLLKKTRIKQLLKMVLVTLLVMGVIGLVMLVGDKKLSTRNYQKLDERLNLYHRIAAPNIQIDSQVIASSHLFGGEIKTNRSKTVEGYLIPWSNLTSQYNWFLGSMDLNEMTPGWVDNETNSYEYDRQTKQKYATFYYPQVTDYYDGVKNEALDLAKLPNHVAEVALSFDQAYTYTDIQQMIPKELHIVWYWAGVGEHDLDESKGPSGVEKYGFNVAADVNKKEVQAGFEEFIVDLGNQSESGGEKAVTTIAKEYQDKRLEAAKFTGVMVTGETEKFGSLMDRKWLRGSSVGVTAERVPYLRSSK